MAVLRPELSAVVLCYLAGDGADGVVEPLQRQLEGSGVSYELILVANHTPGSADKTPAVVERLARTHASVRTVLEPKQGGVGWDLRKGLAAARGRYLVFLDGDGQVPVEYVLDTYRLLVASSADIVKGRRTARGDGTARTVTSLAYNVLFRCMFGTRGLWDINGQPKGMTRSAYDALDVQSNDWFIDAEIVLKARSLGMKIEEFGVVFRRNETRPSFVGVGTGVEFLANMIRWRLGRHPALRRSASAPVLSAADSIEREPTVRV